MRRLLFCFGAVLMLLPAACSPATPSSTPATTSAPAPTTTRPAASPTAKPGPASPTAAANQPATPRITAGGRLSFVDDRGLTFQTAGQIAKISAVELDKVTKGQLLAKLDTSTLDQAVKTAEYAATAADLSYKSASTDRLLASSAIKSAEADLATVKANVASASVDLDLATDNFRKITYPYNYSTFAFDVPQASAYITEAKRLLDEAAKGMSANLTAGQYTAAAKNLQDAIDNLNKGQGLLQRGQGTDVFTNGTLAVSNFWTLRAAQLAVDKAQLTLQNTQTAVDKSTVALDNAKNAFTKAQIAESRAKNDLDRATNDVDKAKQELTKATIVAPFDGVVAKVNSKENDLLTSGSYAGTVVLQVIDPRRMELAVKVNELDVANVKLGQKAVITVDALPDQKINAFVTTVSSLPTVESNIYSYIVKIAFDVPAASPLKSGMAATADITLTK